MKRAFKTGQDLIKIKNRLSYPDFDITIDGNNVDWILPDEDERSSSIHKDRVFVVRARLSSLEIEDDVSEGFVLFDYESLKITQDFDCELSEFMCHILLNEIINSLQGSKTAYIYKITNMVNNKVYIGKSNSNPASRWGAHISGREKSPISKAIAIHGVNNFDFKVVEVVAVPPNLVTQKEIDELVISYERKWIISENSIKNGYNGRL